MIENLFSTPLYKTNLNNESILNDLKNLHDKIKSEGKMQYHPDWQSHKLSDYTFKEHLIFEHDLREFHTEVENHLELYLRGMNYTKPVWYRLIECWMTEYGKGDFAHMHTHVPCDVSGVYYVKTPNQKGNGDIFFLNPNQMQNTYVYRHLGDRQWYNPKEGDLILFPSWIQHGVIPNKSEDDRVSIAFNWNFAREHDLDWHGLS